MKLDSIAPPFVTTHHEQREPVASAAPAAKNTPSAATRATLIRLQVQSIEEAILAGDEGKDLIAMLDRVQQALSGLGDQRHARMLVLEAVDATVKLKNSLPALSEAMGRTVESIDEVEVVRAHVRAQFPDVAARMSEPDITMALAYWNRGQGKKSDGMGSKWVWFGKTWFPRLRLGRVTAGLANEWTRFRPHLAAIPSQL